MNASKLYGTGVERAGVLATFILLAGGAGTGVSKVVTVSA
jgi:hypothetical protein